MRPVGDKLGHMRDESIELLRALIRNSCVNDGTVESGHEERSVRTLVDYFGVPGDVFEPEPGRQSLIYRIKGTDPEAPTLALAPHLDVVPADRVRLVARSVLCRDQ